MGFNGFSMGGGTGMDFQWILNGRRNWNGFSMGFEWEEELEWVSMGFQWEEELEWIFNGF